MPSTAPPLVARVPCADPGAALRALEPLPHAFAFHSSLVREDARWSFFGADPFRVCRGDDACARSLWRRLADRAPTLDEIASEAAVPFTGGVVGYWAYDFGRRLERLPSHAADDLSLPEAVLGFYDVVGAFDHARGTCWLFSSGRPEEGARGATRAATRLAFFAERLGRAATGPAAEGLPELVAAPAPRLAGDTAPRVARSTFTPSGYRRAVEAVKEHIARGDIFQANLSQRWTMTLAAAHDAATRHGAASVVPARGASAAFRPVALALAAALAERSPSPYAAYFDAGDHAIVSASPERFLQLQGGAVETKPIKGTRPRGADLAADARLAAELLASPKDRAENVMIVDVLRNDLGRVCVHGSVETPTLCALERFPQVHHLVSTVTGRLHSRHDAFDLLHACFPGGSITGAPKIRAMEIIDALEPVRRHIYTGALGYIGWNGNADWNIAIRTALVTPGAVHFAAGGGITADSDPDAEYAETLHKAEGLRAALSQVLGPVRLEPRAVHA